MCGDVRHGSRTGASAAVRTRDRARLYWPYATTLFDYIRRAMPFPETKSLTNDEVYAVAAYILNLNGVVGTDEVLDAQSLPKVKMPNRDGFIPFPRDPK